jgi:hypothetical protein
MKFTLSSSSAENAVELLRLPGRLTELLVERGISTLDQLYGLFLSSPQMVERLFVDFHVDYKSYLPELRRLIPAETLQRLEQLNRVPMKRGKMGVTPTPRPDGKVRSLRRLPGGEIAASDRDPEDRAPPDNRAPGNGTPTARRTPWPAYGGKGDS